MVSLKDTLLFILWFPFILWVNFQLIYLHTRSQGVILWVLGFTVLLGIDYAITKKVAFFKWLSITAPCTAFFGLSQIGFNNTGAGTVFGLFAGMGLLAFVTYLAVRFN